MKNTEKAYIHQIAQEARAKHRENKKAWARMIEAAGRSDYWSAWCIASKIGADEAKQAYEMILAAQCE